MSEHPSLARQIGEGVGAALAVAVTAALWLGLFMATVGAWAIGVLWLLGVLS